LRSLIEAVQRYLFIAHEDWAIWCMVSRTFCPVCNVCKMNAIVLRTLIRGRRAGEGRGLQQINYFQYNTYKRYRKYLNERSLFLI
jgi:hypothetical protein